MVQNNNQVWQKKYTIKVVPNTQNIRYSTYNKNNVIQSNFPLLGLVGNKDQALTFVTIQELMTTEKRH